MADAPVFELVCSELEARTALGRLEARGTVRLALKEGGLTAADVGVREMRVVLDRLLPAALGSRGVEDAAAICAAIRAATSVLGEGAAATSSPEAVFGRLGG